MQITENWSRIRGRVEAWQPPKKSGDAGVLTLVVDRVDDVMSRDGARHRNLLKEAAGTTVKVIVPASAADRLAAKPGSTADLEVRKGSSAGKVFAHPERITLTR